MSSVPLNNNIDRKTEDKHFRFIEHKCYIVVVMRPGRDLLKTARERRLDKAGTETARRQLLETQ